MTGSAAIRRIWPDPTGEVLDETALIEAYGRPAPAHLRVNFVASVDGAVTLAGYSAGLSGEPDKRVFRVLRMLCDGLLVAAGTLRHEGYRALRMNPARLSWRRAHGLAEHPTLVVVSASLRLDPAAPVFADAPARPLILTHRGAVAPTGLESVADLLRCGDDRVDLTAGLAELRRRGLAQLLCEGGPQLFGTLTGADLVDEVCLTVSPLLAGAGPGRITAGPPSEPRPMPLRHALVADDGVVLLRYARR